MIFDFLTVFKHVLYLLCYYFVLHRIAICLFVVLIKRYEHYFCRLVIFIIKFTVPKFFISIIIHLTCVLCHKIVEQKIHKINHRLTTSEILA